MENEKRIGIARINRDFRLADLRNENWDRADEITVNKYWSGEDAPFERNFKTRLLWSPTALYVRFEANQAEPPVISEKPDLNGKTYALWERDVCEIFLAPDKNNFRKYFEFEVAPTGEWIDLAVHQMPEKRETDFDYLSGIRTAAEIEDDKVWMTFNVEWQAFGRIPRSGEIWKGNLLRCVGIGDTRGYLTWQPTLTEKPNFHVPEKFGDFEFLD